MRAQLHLVDEAGKQLIEFEGEGETVTGLADVEDRLGVVGHGEVGFYPSGSVGEELGGFVVLKLLEAG